MMILSLALHLDPVFVGAHHLARVIFLSLALPAVVRCTAKPRPRLSGRARPSLPRNDGLGD